MSNLYIYSHLVAMPRFLVAVGSAPPKKRVLPRRPTLLALFVRGSICIHAYLLHHVTRQTEQAGLEPGQPLPHPWIRLIVDAECMGPESASSSLVAGGSPAMCQPSSSSGEQLGSVAERLRETGPSGAATRVGAPTMHP